MPAAGLRTRRRQSSGRRFPGTLQRVGPTDFHWQRNRCSARPCCRSVPSEPFVLHRQRYRAALHLDVSRCLLPGFECPARRRLHACHSRLFPGRQHGQRLELHGRCDTLELGRSGRASPRPVHRRRQSERHLDGPQSELRRWSRLGGTGAITSSGVAQYMVETVDAAGNVSVSNNEARISTARFRQRPRCRRR